MRRVLLGFSFLVACNEHETVDVPLVRSTEWVAGTVCQPAPPKVDVLLVVDDSPSMADQADVLASNLRAIGGVYAEVDLDYRIAVTSTHVPGPDCAPGRGDGALVSSSCRDRLEDFVVAANEESEALDLRAICEDNCDTTTVSQGPW